MVKLVIAGSRGITDITPVKEAAEESPWDIDENYPSTCKVEEIVHGGAKGVDTSANQLAESLGIPVRIFEPDWDELGKSAGPARNKEMAEYGDCLVAIWDGSSSGTRNMITVALHEGLDVYVKQV